MKAGAPLIEDHCEKTVLQHLFSQQLHLEKRSLQSFFLSAEHCLDQSEGQKCKVHTPCGSFSCSELHRFVFSTCDKFTFCNFSLCISLGNLSRLGHLLLIMETSPTPPPTERQFISQLQFCILKASYPPTSRQPRQTAVLGLGL